MIRHRKAHLLKIFSISLLCLIFMSCGEVENNGPTSATPSPTPEKPPVLVFLLDPTSSLNEPERTHVGTLAADVLEVLPPGSKYGIYPIQIDSGRAPAIIPDDDVPDQTTDVEVRAYQKKLAELKIQIADKLKELYKTGDRVADDKRSCIIDMLWFAEDRLKQISGNQSLDSQNGPYRLVIISDMVEECGSSTLREIRLNKRDIAEEINKADNFSQSTTPPNLSNVSVTVIFPLTDKSPVDLSRRPSDRDLRAFWKKIFNHCQLPDEKLDWIPNGQLPHWYHVLEAKHKELTEQK